MPVVTRPLTCVSPATPPPGLLVLYSTSKEVRVNSRHAASVSRFVRWRLWPWRVEALVAFGLWHTWSVLTGYVGSGLALAALLVLGLSAEVRSWIRQLLKRARLLRRWMAAARHAGLATEDARLPRIVGLDHVGGYQRLRVQVPRGGRVADLERGAEAIAAMLQVSQVQVIRHLPNARYADLLLVHSDDAAIQDQQPTWSPPAGITTRGAASVLRSLPKKLDR